MNRASLLLLPLGVACAEEHFIRAEVDEARLLIVAEIDAVGTPIHASVRYAPASEAVRYTLSGREAEGLVIFEVPAHHFQTNELAPVPEAWFQQVTVQVGSAPASAGTGACRRCQIPTSEPPFIVSPGDECPVFAPGRVLDESDFELADSKGAELARSVGGRLRLAWPGACACELPEEPPDPVELSVCAHDFDANTYHPERWHLSSDGRIVSVDQGYVFELRPGSTSAVVTPRVRAVRAEESGSRGALLPGGGVVSFWRELGREPAYLELWRGGPNPQRLELGLPNVEHVHPLLDGTRDALVLADEGALIRVGAAYHCRALGEGASDCTRVSVAETEDCSLHLFTLKSLALGPSRHVLETNHTNYLVFDEEAQEIACVFPAARARWVSMPDDPSRTGTFHRDGAASMAAAGTRLFVPGFLDFEEERWRVVVSVETVGPAAWSRFEVAAARPAEEYEHPLLWVESSSPHRVSVLWNHRASPDGDQYMELDASGGAVSMEPVSASAHFGIPDRVERVMSSTTGWVVLETKGPRFHRRAPDQSEFEFVHGPSLPAGRTHLVERDDHHLLQIGPGPRVFELLVVETEACPRVERTEVFRLEGIDEVLAVAPRLEDGRVVAGADRRGRSGIAYIDLRDGAVEWMHPADESAPLRQIVNGVPGRWIAVDTNDAAWLVTRTSVAPLLPSDATDLPRVSVRTAASAGGVVYLGGDELLFQLLPSSFEAPRRTANLLPAFSGAAWTAFEVGSRGVPLSKEWSAGIVDRAGARVFVHSGRDDVNSTVHAHGSARTILPFRDPASVLEYGDLIFVSGPRGQLASIRARRR